MKKYTKSVIKKAYDKEEKLEVNGFYMDGKKKECGEYEVLAVEISKTEYNKNIIENNGDYRNLEVTCWDKEGINEYAELFVKNFIAIKEEAENGKEK